MKVNTTAPQPVDDSTNEPDYETLRQLIQRDTGKPVDLEKARRIGAFLLRLTTLLNELK